MYDLHAAPSAESPRYAFHKGCISDPNDFQGGTGDENIESFLNAELPAQRDVGRLTRALRKREPRAPGRPDSVVPLDASGGRKKKLSKA
jgi:hypothetical protein